MTVSRRPYVFRIWPTLSAPLFPGFCAFALLLPLIHFQLFKCLTALIHTSNRLAQGFAIFAYCFVPYSELSAIL